MAKINQNQLAVEVAGLEGGDKNLSIAQVKEVIKCLKLELMSPKYKASDILVLFGK